MYSTLLPRTDIPTPTINKINKQIITECSRLPIVHLISHSNLFEPELDLLHDTKHIKRRHIGLFAANLIDAIRGRARQPRYTAKSSQNLNQSPRLRRSDPKYASYNHAVQNLSAGNLQFPYQSWHRHREPGNWGEPQTVQHKHHPQQQSQELDQLHKLP